MGDVAGALALGAPVLQAGLMALIGYPLAMRSARAMARFRRSGFGWWLVTLLAVIVLAALAGGGAFDVVAPAGPVLWILAVVAGLVACLVVEIGAEVLARRRDGDDVHDRYSSALPAWVGSPGTEVVLLGVLAVLEEAVYRGVALPYLLALGVGPLWAVAASAVAFGLAHWYFGLGQIGRKTALGVVLGLLALVTGWWGAALCHLLLNVALIALQRAARSSRVTNRA
jgi:Type II CAAX prenyl endopeptidase Rce1-like